VSTANTAATPSSGYSKGSEQKRFIEGSAPPTDAVHVDYTWQYVNVKGGPDRRYANDPMRPIMLYGRLLFTTANGLYWIIQISRAEAAQPVAHVLSAGSSVIGCRP
jgi:hypothetical protein